MTILELIDRKRQDVYAELSEIEQKMKRNYNPKQETNDEEHKEEFTLEDEDVEMKECHPGNQIEKDSEEIEQHTEDSVNFEVAKEDESKIEKDIENSSQQEEDITKSESRVPEIETKTSEEPEKEEIKTEQIVEIKEDIQEATPALPPVEEEEGEISHNES